MSLSKNRLIIGGSIAVAALGLVGAGAGATFTDSVFASQKVQVGTLGVRIDPVGTDGYNLDDKHVRLNDVGPTASSFHSEPMQVKITNTGNVVAHTYRLSLTQVNDDAALTGLKVKVTSYSPTASTPPSTPVTVFDGTIAAFQANPVLVVGDLQPAGDPGDFDKLNIEFYTPDGTSLENSDMGKSITTTIETEYVG